MVMFKAVIPLVDHWFDIHHLKVEQSHLFKLGLY